MTIFLPRTAYLLSVTSIVRWLPPRSTLSRVTASAGSLPTFNTSPSASWIGVSSTAVTTSPAFRP